MITEAGKRTIVDFVANKSPQAGGPLASTQIAEMAHQTEAAWTVAGRNTVYHYYPEPVVAPTGRVTTVPGTDTLGSDGTATTNRGNHRMPWVVGVGMDNVIAQCTFAVEESQQSRILVSLNSATLIDSVAASNGEFVPLNMANSRPPGVGAWSADLYGGRWRFVHRSMILRSPTLPANRRIALNIIAKFQNENDSEWAVTGAPRVLKLVYIRIRDDVNTPPPLEA
jgi:hypothetical protein